MGQTQGRIDPSYRHSTAATHHASLPPTPGFPEPPFSAPPAFDERLVHSLSSKPRLLVRKLSQNKSPVKTLIREFEDMVTVAEAAIGELQNGPAAAGKRASEQCQSSSTSSPRVTPTRPTMHRRTSSSTSKSSIKSPRRAEREWRAKVAALSHAAHAHGGPKGTTIRGPVPPKRTPPSRPLLDSPASDMLLTPPQTAPIIMVNDSEKKLAKSFSSGKSFATLGHHLGRPLHDRKASVPRSAMSSFYFDNTVSRVSSRPPSATASGTLQSSRDNKESRAPNPAQSFVAQAIRLQPQAELPPSDISALDVSSPPLLTANLEPASEIDASTALAEPPTRGVQDGQPQPQPLPLPIKQPPREEDSSRERLKFSPRPLSCQTPSRPHHAKKNSTPATPVSPMTSFLLTAPIESISITAPQALSPERKGHPFAWRDSTSTSTAKVGAVTAPTLVAKPPKAVKPEAKPLPPIKPKVKDQVPVPFDVVSIKGKMSQVKRNDLFASTVRPDKRAAADQSRILQPKKTQETRSKVALVGTGHQYPRDQLERQKEEMRKMAVDLTPGMETGERPPKSGLPMADLQKWLAQSALV